MQIIPAIDLKNGRCVRLAQGRKADVTVYDENPVEVAQSFAAAGAEMIHVVDLDGAFQGGESRNRAVLAKIVEAVDVPIEFGGGIRSREEVQRLQGELLRAQGATLNEVEHSYLAALETARAQQAKSPELRVVMSLANLWHWQGRTAEAHQLLAETYAWFREGLDTADLRAARLLLDHLSSQSFERRLTS